MIHRASNSREQKENKNLKICFLSPFVSHSCALSSFSLYNFHVLELISDLCDWAMTQLKCFNRNKTLHEASIRENFLWHFQIRSDFICCTSFIWFLFSDANQFERLPMRIVQLMVSFSKFNTLFSHRKIDMSHYHTGYKAHNQLNTIILIQNAVWHNLNSPFGAVALNFGPKMGGCPSVSEENSP